MSLNKIVENMGVQCLPVAYPVILGITYEMNVKMLVFVQTNTPVLAYWLS